MESYHLSSSVTTAGPGSVEIRLQEGLGTLSPEESEDLSKLEKSHDVPDAVRAMQHLTQVIRNSKATTLMELQLELKGAAQEIKRKSPGKQIALTAACEIFLRSVSRRGDWEMTSLEAAKARLLERGEAFKVVTLKARSKIASLGAPFIPEGGVVLVHGLSRCVYALLKHAATVQRRKFSVYVVEGRPHNSGTVVAQNLAASGVPVKIILDSAVAFVMERIDIILVGAEGVVENGIINALGTYQVAIIAKAMSKPVYVAAECYKFVRFFPFNQQDLPSEPKSDNDFSSLSLPGVELETATRDFTPANLITLLFTDIGVLTPSAVSDELIKLYLW